MKTFWELVRLFIYVTVVSIIFIKIKSIFFPDMESWVETVIAISIGFFVVLYEKTITRYLNHAFIQPWRK